MPSRPCARLESAQHGAGVLRRRYCARPIQLVTESRGSPMTPSGQDQGLSRRTFLVAGSAAIAATAASAACSPSSEGSGSVAAQGTEPAAASVPVKNSGLALPPLPWKEDALAPVISANTISFHYGKHHKAYFDNLAKAVEGKPYAKMSLE